MNRVILNAIFPGDPVAWERLNPRGFKPKKTRQAQVRLRTQLAQIAPRLKPNDRARFGVQLTFRTTSARKDGDNCEKLILDAFNKTIWQDDSQIDKCQWEMVRILAGIENTHLIVYIIEREGK